MNPQDDRKRKPTRSLPTSSQQANAATTNAQPSNTTQNTAAPGTDNQRDTTDPKNPFPDDPWKGRWKKETNNKGKGQTTSQQDKSNKGQSKDKG